MHLMDHYHLVHLMNAKDHPFRSARSRAFKENRWPPILGGKQEQKELQDVHLSLKHTADGFQATSLYTARQQSAASHGSESSTLGAEERDLKGRALSGDFGFCIFEREGFIWE